MLREESFLRELLIGRFRDPEIDDLGRGFAVIQRHQNIVGFDVAMDDAFMMRVLYGFTNLSKEIQSFLEIQFSVIGKTL